MDFDGGPQRRIGERTDDSGRKQWHEEGCDKPQLKARDLIPVLVLMDGERSKMSYSRVGQFEGGRGGKNYMTSKQPQTTQRRGKGGGWRGFFRVNGGFPLPDRGDRVGIKKGKDKLREMAI